MNLSTEFSPVSVFFVSVFCKRHIEKFIISVKAEKLVNVWVNWKKLWNIICGSVHNLCPHSLSCSSKSLYLFLIHLRDDRKFFCTLHVVSVYMYVHVRQGCLTLIVWYLWQKIVRRISWCSDLKFWMFSFY